MAGGVKKPVNIFKLKDLNDPKEVFNWRLCTVEKANIKANVSAMVQIGSVGGALFAFFVCDRIGRVWATRQLCLLWILGIAIFLGNNGSLGAVYAGRFIAGLGVGQTPVVSPLYLAEISPPSIRGLCTCIFTGFVYLGIVLAYFANYGAQVHLGDTTPKRWQVPTSLHIMFASLIFILSFLQYESPRYYIRRGQDDKALAVMARVRNLPADHEYVVREIAEIQRSYQEELEATMGAGIVGILKEMFLMPSNLYRLYLASMAQILSQWSGAGSITLYAPDLFNLLGITGNNQNLLVTAIFGLIKLAAAVVCALFLVDVIGRKRSLLIGIGLQAISMIYVAGFLTAEPKMGVVKDYELPESSKGASRGAIAMIYISGFGWALGWNSMQYLLTAELFPLRIRAVATSISMTLHFANQYGNSRAVPNMLLPVSSGGLSPRGTFWFFAAVTVIGGLWVWVSVPETAGRSLESMDRLFALPWYKIGLYGNEDAERRDLAINQKVLAAEGTAEHVEVVGESTTRNNRDNATRV